jgi:hypothetical protein
VQASLPEQLFALWKNLPPIFCVDLHGLGA